MVDNVYGDGGRGKSVSDVVPFILKLSYSSVSLVWRTAAEEPVFLGRFELSSSYLYKACANTLILTEYMCVYCA